jgi:hypothetical protein
MQMRSRAFHRLDGSDQNKPLYDDNESLRTNLVDAGEIY